jgi:hypothetical protein
MALETVRVGPVPLSSTWIIERMIGILGGQIRQPSNPYHNLSQRGLQQCQVNALLAAYPNLSRDKTPTPKLVENLGDGYSFLSARERTPRIHLGLVGKAVHKYFVDEEAVIGNPALANWSGPRICQWAHLQLPNGQIARCAWKECAKSVANVCCARV